MTKEHFAVHPEKLRSLSEAFTRTGARLEEQITAFAGRAENVDDAFGVLSESTEALQKYVEMVQATVVSLQQLRRQLAGYAGGLNHSAAAYEHAEARHASAFQGA
ncbi:WXG100 family type VII secretion target [Streptomyces rimosus]|uniref:WXG100 family type VII secretion target n=1 Tax=Streptomyces rimosus TaxID=1927 RepID=UPI0004C824AC|nr:type VII secretion target [Streptomyces rimosus]KWT63872.1 hypothetical protein ADL21_00495 [Streptomyces albus subsp. albus]